MADPRNMVKSVSQYAQVKVHALTHTECVNHGMRNECIFNRFPIFFYICFFFLSSFSIRMVFKKINTLLILMVIGMRIVRKNVVVLEEVHDG